MNRVLRTSIVVLATALSMGALYALIQTPSPSQANPKTLNSSISDSKAKSSSKLDNAPSFTPDLSHTNGYSFLDLLPLGKQAPSFSAQTGQGKPVKLKDYLNKKNVVLVFYQGSFCSVCEAQLSNIQQHIAEFDKKQAEVIAISADDIPHAKQRMGESGLSFPVVADNNKSIIKTYGVANISKKGIAWPSVYIINKKGNIAYHFANETGKRLYAQEILSHIP